MSNVTIFQESITDIFCDYLEVLIHSFFYYTHYYDSVLFERRIKYNTIVYMCRSPDVIKYVQDLVKSLRQWLSRDGLMNIHFQITTIDGEVIQTIAIKQICDSLSRHEMIDYDKLEASLHNGLSSFHTIPFNTDMPNNVLFNVKVDVCESASTKPEYDWNLTSSMTDKQPLFPNPSESRITPLSTIFAGQMVFQIFASIRH